jgi:hypothetical protein
MAEYLQFINDSYQNALNGLLMEDLEGIRESKEDLNSLMVQNKTLKLKLYKSIQRIQERKTETSRLYLFLYDLEQDIIQSTTYIVEACAEHVENHFNPLTPEQAQTLQLSMDSVSGFLLTTSQRMHDMQFESIRSHQERYLDLVAKLEGMLDNQIQGVKSSDYSYRSSMLLFSIILETLDLIAAAEKLIKLYHQVQTVSQAERLDVSSE